jgi:hypothetical protein
MMWKHWTHISPFTSGNSEVCFPFPTSDCDGRMLPLFWLDKAGICSEGDNHCLSYTVGIEDPSFERFWNSNHMKCFCFHSGTLGFVYYTLRLTFNSLTHGYINIINHEFRVFHSGVAEDMMMHQWVIGSWHSKATHWPHLECSKCPRRDLVTSSCSIIFQKDGILIINHHLIIYHPYTNQTSLSAQNYIHISSTLQVSHLWSNFSKSSAFHFHTRCVSTSTESCFLPTCYLIIHSAMWPVCIPLKL